MYTWCWTVFILLASAHLLRIDTAAAVRPFHYRAVQYTSSDSAHARPVVQSSVFCLPAAGWYAWLGTTCMKITCVSQSRTLITHNRFRRVILSIYFVVNQEFVVPDCSIISILSCFNHLFPQFTYVPFRSNLCSFAGPIAPISFLEVHWLSEKYSPNLYTLWTWQLLFSFQLCPNTLICALFLFQLPFYRAF